MSIPGGTLLEPHFFGVRRQTMTRIAAIAMVILPQLLGGGCAKSVHSYNQFSTNPAHPVDDWSPATANQEMLARPPEELLARGYRYLAQGHESLAALHFLTALEKNPESAAAHAGLGEVALRKNLPPKALAHYLLALKSDGKNRIALLGLGRIHRQSGELEMSVRYLTEAATAYPQEPDLLGELAMSYDFLGQWERAESLYRQAITLDGCGAAIHNNLGYNLLLQGRYREAAQAFQQSLLRQGDNNRTQNNLATAFILSGQEELALPYLEKTVGQAAAHNNLGYIYICRGSWEQAERELREAIARNPAYYKLANQNLALLQRKKNEAPEKLSAAPPQP